MAAGWTEVTQEIIAYNNLLAVAVLYVMYNQSMYSSSYHLQLIQDQGIPRFPLVFSGQTGHIIAPASSGSTTGLLSVGTCLEGLAAAAAANHRGKSTALFLGLSSLVIMLNWFEPPH